jgi:TPR repeat protein
MLMKRSGKTREPKNRRSKPVIGFLLTAFLVSAAPLAAQAHGRNAIPTDPKLLEQYQAGLAAYLNSDYVAALEAWRPLAERTSESSTAQIFLGFMYANGQGLPKNPAAAAGWYRRGAEQDNVLAQIRLGFMYRAGKGVPQDDVQAHLWASLAARQKGHVQKVAQALQQALEAGMTPARIAEAKRLAKEWAAAHREAE